MLGAEGQLPDRMADVQRGRQEAILVVVLAQLVEEALPPQPGLTSH